MNRTRMAILLAEILAIATLRVIYVLQQQRKNKKKVVYKQRDWVTEFEDQIPFDELYKPPKK